jgi:predicted nucleotidyltransferase
MKQIRTVQEIGNGAHVYLPKELVGKQVEIKIVEKNPYEILLGVMNFLYNKLTHIKGIYLCGSYAKGEQTIDSDIDILVITDNKIKSKNQKIGAYDIVFSSLDDIKITLKENPLMIYPLIRECKPLINAELIKELKKPEIKKSNTRWFLETTKSALDLNKELIGYEETNTNEIVYSLIMRLRGLYILDTIINKKPYTKMGFLRFLQKKKLTKETINNMYSIYSIIRDDKELKKEEDLDQIKSLLEISEEYLKEIKSKWAKLK